MTANNTKSPERINKELRTLRDVMLAAFFFVVWLQLTTIILHLDYKLMDGLGGMVMGFGVLLIPLWLVADLNVIWDQSSSMNSDSMEVDEERSQTLSSELQ